MKSFLTFLIAAITQASAFDQAALGESLNGWTRDGSAHYSLDSIPYRTLRPVEKIAEDGTTTVRVTVIHRANSWAEVPFDLEVSISANGQAQAFRIHGKPRGQKVDTGLITRPSPPTPADGEEAVPFHPIEEMKKMLFDSFEGQVLRAAEAKDTRKRDLLARMHGPEPIDPDALEKGLRFNLDRILGIRLRIESK